MESQVTWQEMVGVIAAVTLLLEIAIFFIMHPICILITLIAIVVITLLTVLRSVGIL